MSSLILFPVPIGADDLAVSVPAYNLPLLYGCHTFIVEELRTARRFLKHAGYPYPIDETTFHLLNEHTSPEEITHYLDPIDKGEDVGLLSEAGLPCVADPGALVTRMALSNSRIIGTCCFNSGAMGFLVPLYWAYCLWRKVGADKSKATMK